MENKNIDKIVVKVIIKEMNTKDGKRKFNTYSCMTCKEAWFDMRFVGESKAPTKSGTIIKLIEGVNFFMDFKKNSDTDKYILDKDGNKIPVIVVFGKYDEVAKEEAPEVLTATKKVFDDYKKYF